MNSILKRAFTQMNKDGWRLGDITVDDSLEYFESAFSHFEELYNLNGEEEFSVENTNFSVENTNEYFEMAVNHLEQVFQGEEELQVIHLGFILDFLLAIKKMDETIDITK